MIYGRAIECFNVLFSMIKLPEKKRSTSRHVEIALGLLERITSNPIVPVPSSLKLRQVSQGATRPYLPIPTPLQSQPSPSDEVLYKVPPQFPGSFSPRKRHLPFNTPATPKKANAERLDSLRVTPTEGQSIADLFPTKVFGRDEWIKCFGDPGEVPPIPVAARAILRHNCPFTGQNASSTHMLMLMPATITTIMADGQVKTLPTSFNTLIRLGDMKGNYFGQTYHCPTELRHQSVKTSHWALVTVPFLRAHSGDDLRTQIKTIEDNDYELPALLHAAILLYMYPQIVKQPLIPKREGTALLCQDLTSDQRHLTLGCRLPGHSVSLSRVSYPPAGPVATSGVIVNPVELVPEEECRILALRSLR